MRNNRLILHIQSLKSIPIRAYFDRKIILKNNDYTWIISVIT